MAQEKPGQTLQATGLVHEAYLRLVDVEKAQHWDSRGHFFAAAAEAMRRFWSKRLAAKSESGTAADRLVPPRQLDLAESASDELLALDEALERARGRRSGGTQVVKLRYFAGLSIEETAAAWASPPELQTVTGLTPRRGCSGNWPIEFRTKNLNFRGTSWANTSHWYVTGLRSETDQAPE